MEAEGEVLNFFEINESKGDIFFKCEVSRQYFTNFNIQKFNFTRFVN